MSVSVTMPRLGESVTEGTVTRWLKKEGDQVAVDEPLLEVSTDKVDTEIPSPVAGILSKITVAEDETVEVGSELAVIDDGSASAAPVCADNRTDDNSAGRRGAGAVRTRSRRTRTRRTRTRSRPHPHQPPQSLHPQPPHPRRLHPQSRRPRLRLRRSPLLPQRQRSPQ